MIPTEKAKELVKVTEKKMNKYLKQIENFLNEVAINKSNYDYPIKKDRNGLYKLPGGTFVRVCITSDFFLEEADEWRDKAWDYIRKRTDVTFSLLTKRAHRIKDNLP